MDLDHWLKKRSIEHRLKIAYLLWSAHSAAFILIFALEKNISVSLILLQLMGNVYPVMVQLKTGLRIKKILEKKKLKK